MSSAIVAPGDRYRFVSGGVSADAKHGTGSDSIEPLNKPPVWLSNERAAGFWGSAQMVIDTW